MSRQLTIEDQFGCYEMLRKLVRQMASTYDELIFFDPMMKELGCDIAEEFIESMFLPLQALQKCTPPFEPPGFLDEVIRLTDELLRIYKASAKEAKPHDDFFRHPRWERIRNQAKDMVARYRLADPLTLEEFEAGAR